MVIGWLLMVTCLCQKCCSMLMQLSIRSEDGGVGMPLRGVKRSDCRGRTGRSKFYTVIGLHCFNGLNYSAPAAMPAAMLCIRLSECRNLRGRGGTSCRHVSERTFGTPQYWWWLARQSHNLYHLTLRFWMAGVGFRSFKWFENRQQKTGDLNAL